MIKGKTKSGFEFCINPDDLDDMRFIDALASLDKNNFIAMSEVADFMFDKEQKKAIYAHLANLDEKGKNSLDKPFPRAYDMHVLALARDEC